MVTTQNPSPWHDRFAEPAMDSIADHYEPDAAAVVERLHTEMQAHTSALPRIEWRGIAWKWTLSYKRPGEDEPWAYLVPTTGHPTVALPVPVQPLQPAELRKTPRFLQQSIKAAPRIGRICWIETTVESKAQANELCEFISRVTGALES